MSAERKPWWRRYGWTNGDVVVMLSIAFVVTTALDVLQASACR